MKAKYTFLTTLLKEIKFLICRFHLSFFHALLLSVLQIICSGQALSDHKGLQPTLHTAA